METESEFFEEDELEVGVGSGCLRFFEGVGLEDLVLGAIWRK